MARIHWIASRLRLFVFNDQSAVVDRPSKLWMEPDRSSIRNGDQTMAVVVTCLAPSEILTICRHAGGQVSRLEVDSPVKQPQTKVRLFPLYSFENA